MTTSRATSPPPAGFRRREQVFSGWGEPGAGPSLPDHASDLLRDRLGVSGDVVSRPVTLDVVLLSPSALPSRAQARLAEGAGAVIAGCAFLVELSFLDGREKLAPYDVHALVSYDAE